MEDPEQHAAWVFAAGVPDARGEKYPHQPMIPAPNFKAVSKMLWDMGFRHNPELQKLWVKKSSGPDRNFQAWGVTDKSPAAEMLAEIDPEKAMATARAAAGITPENLAEKQAEATKALLESIGVLNAAVQASEGGVTG